MAKAKPCPKCQCRQVRVYRAPHKIKAHMRYYCAKCFYDADVESWNDQPAQDEMRVRIAQLEEWLNTIAKDCALMADFIKQFNALVNESQGVAGYHLNGNIADWNELLDSDFEMALEAALKY